MFLVAPLARWGAGGRVSRFGTSLYLMPLLRRPFVRPSARPYASRHFASLQGGSSSVVALSPLQTRAARFDDCCHICEEDIFNHPLLGVNCRIGSVDFALRPVHCLLSNQWMSTSDSFSLAERLALFEVAHYQQTNYGCQQRFVLVSPILFPSRATNSD